ISALLCGAAPGGAGGTAAGRAPSLRARIRWEPVRRRRVAVVPPARFEPIAADWTLLADVADETGAETGSAPTAAPARGDQGRCWTRPRERAGEPQTSQYPSRM